MGLQVSRDQMEVEFTGRVQPLVSAPEGKQKVDGSPFGSTLSRKSVGYLRETFQSSEFSSIASPSSSLLNQSQLREQEVAPPGC